ncbi:MAG: M1 family metallopeptidase, partial [Bacteroidia bacterium]|nr:M1 family metallopeptidase [Bacteroidia bacterium]
MKWYFWILACFFQVAVAQKSCEDEFFWLDDPHPLPQQFKTTNIAQNIDLCYLRLELTANPEVHWLSGKATYYLRFRENSHTITFDFDDSLQIQQVIWNNQSLNFYQNPLTCTIEFPSEQLPGRLDSVQIRYSGAPPLRNLAFMIQNHATGKVISTLSEPYGSRDWFPSKMTLNDKLDSLDVIVTCPQQWKAVSNGLLVSETIDSGNRISHWKHRYPVTTYNVAIAISNYEIQRFHAILNNGQSVLVENYVYPQDTAEATTATLFNIESLKLFSDKLEIYPFASEKYGQTQFNRPGGMEHQTNSFVGLYEYTLLIHELVHQWFGNLVTCGSWKDIWFNEGITHFLTGYAIEQLRPQDNRFWREHRRRRLLSQPSGSIYVDDTTSISRIFSGALTYHKAAAVINQLRWQIGEEVLFRGLRAMLQDSTARFGYMTTPSIQKHLEKAAGMSLSDFFQTWIYGEGFPKYQLTWSQQPSSKTVRIELESLSNGTNFRRYNYSLPYRIYGQKENQPIFQDGIIHLTENGSKGQALVFLDWSADSVILDPDLWMVLDTTIHIRKEI